MFVSRTGRIFIRYVDELLLCHRSKYIHTIEHKFQQCLDKNQQMGKPKMGLDFLKLEVCISVIIENYTMILAWNLKIHKFQL